MTHPDSVAVVVVEEDAFCLRRVQFDCPEVFPVFHYNYFMLQVIDFWSWTSGREPMTEEEEEETACGGNSCFGG